MNDIKTLSNTSIWFRNKGGTTAIHWTMAMKHLLKIIRLPPKEEKLDTLNSRIVSVAEVWSSTVVGSNSKVERELARLNGEAKAREERRDFLRGKLAVLKLARRNKEEKEEEARKEEEETTTTRKTQKNEKE